MADCGEAIAPESWWGSVHAALTDLAPKCDLGDVRALAVDGTSGTVLAVDASASRSARRACMTSRAMMKPSCARSPITRRRKRRARRDLGARAGPDDAGPARRAQPHPAPGGLDRWKAQREVRPQRLEQCAEDRLRSCRDPMARLDRASRSGCREIACRSRARRAHRAGRPGGCQPWPRPLRAVVHAGTTDGCASFLATGAAEAGDGVTALGSTLVVKLLCDRPIFAPEFGIYSHRIGSVWLAGGASNTGGRVIEHFFPRDRLAALSAGLRPDAPTGLGYYPLVKPGERFPINDPALAPRLEPRPENETVFFQAMLEGIAAVEALAYAKLRGAWSARAALRPHGRRRGGQPRLDEDSGAQPRRSVRTGGFGARLRGRRASGAAAPRGEGLSALSRFLTIASSFRAVFFDQYGVLHDGHRPYPGARDALAALKTAGVKTVVLSNSGRAGHANARRMAALGLGPELYDFLVTSGDVARQLMRSGPLAARLHLQARAFVVSSDGRDELVPSLASRPRRGAGKPIW